MQLRVGMWFVAVSFALMACENRPEPVAPLSAPSEVSLSVSSEVTTDQHVFDMNTGIPDGFAEAVGQAGGSVAYSIDAIGVVVTRGLSDAAAQELAQGNGRVEQDVSLQWVPSLAEGEATTVEYDGVAPEAHNPATALFFASDQWNMRQIEAHTAWMAGAQAPGVRVAILDTGLDDKHIDQAGLIDMVASRAFTPSVSPVPGPPWRDDHFHGTHVGGIVVANSVGVAGVAPHATLIAVKVLNASGNGTFGDIIAGIIYATDVGADVINMSLGATFPKSGLGTLVAALNKAVDYAHRHDVVVVSSAGNENEDLQHNENRIKIPCESDVGMCISATGPTQAKASYSNYGSSAIHVAAPGGEIGVPSRGNFILSPCSTYSVRVPACQRPGPGSPYRYLYVVGTSQAAPHVSGVAALLRAQGYEQASQIITTIEDTADDLGKPGTDQIYGRGRVNAARAWTDQ
jgi:subtilisin family serine protease